MVAADEASDDWQYTMLSYSCTQVTEKALCYPTDPSSVFRVARNGVVMLLHVVCRPKLYQWCTIDRVKIAN